MAFSSGHEVLLYLAKSLNKASKQKRGNPGDVTTFLNKTFSMELG
jgi:hypothetical protein